MKLFLSSNAQLHLLILTSLNLLISQAHYNSSITSNLYFQRLLLRGSNKLQMTKVTVQLKLQRDPHLDIFC